MTEKVKKIHEDYKQWGKGKLSQVLTEKENKIMEVWDWVLVNIDDTGLLFQFSDILNDRYNEATEEYLNPKTPLRGTMATNERIFHNNRYRCAVSCGNIL